MGDFDDQSTADSKRKNAFVNATEGALRGLSISFDKLSTLDAFTARAEAYVAKNAITDRTVEQLVLHAVLKRLISAKDYMWIYDPRTHEAKAFEVSDDEFE